MIQLNPHMEIGNLLRQARTIAIVGLSPKENRPSNMVGRYLLGAGYSLFPVNPGHTEILGLKCYPDLVSIPEHIDIVDIFRRSEDVYPIVEEAIKIGAGAIWMQLGIVNREAAAYARQHGLLTVMDRCVKVDHSTLL
ncbi:MAG: CoA-binding protein [Desulfoprunum sp.]|jgi:predicted CoA-binding protein|uniref:CoA-binding protein n=1 Tax=Desulfoprunum sp. TaxID=2020866 RepID=UPI003C70B40F